MTYTGIKKKIPVWLAVLFRIYKDENDTIWLKYGSNCKAWELEKNNLATLSMNVWIVAKLLSSLNFALDIDATAFTRFSRVFFRINRPLYLIWADIFADCLWQTIMCNVAKIAVYILRMRDFVPRVTVMYNSKQKLYKKNN